ncbi:MAG: winged helix-turn-helix transcriptional regulator [Candidatus Micrarchaeaceae archaeon]
MGSIYESATEKYLPVVRFEIANVLKNKYRMKEQEIAERLGITQAAVSKYINKKSMKIMRRAVSLRSRINANKGIIDAYSKNLFEKRADISRFCELCQSLGGFSCGIAKARSSVVR